MARLMVTAYTPVGHFTGKLNCRPTASEDLIITRNEMQARLNEYESLTIFSYPLEGRETTLTKLVIARSVFEFYISDMD